MNNTYGVRPDGNVTILLTKKNGQQHHVIISPEDLETVKAFKGHFYPFAHPKTGKLYARGYYNDPITKKKSEPMLHRLIAKPGRGQNTAHIDGDGLNCTRTNLRNVSIGQDIKDVIEQEKTFSVGLLDVSKNGEAPKNEAVNWDAVDLKNSIEKADNEELTQILTDLKNDGKIEKGVSFHKGKRRWEVSAFHGGKRHRLGYFGPDELIRANEAVVFFRRHGPTAFNEKYKGGRT